MKGTIDWKAITEKRHEGVDVESIRAQIDEIDIVICDLESQLATAEEERQELLNAYQSAKYYDLVNFVACIQADAHAHGDEINKICTYEAFDMLIQWAREGVEFPDGLTLGSFTDEWNRQARNEKKGE